MTSRIYALLASFFLISACGSSGSDSPASPPPPPPPPPPPANEAPVVDAGVDATIQLPTDSVALDATVTDDGLPDGSTVTTTWSVTSGPGGAVFADETAEDTTVTFVDAGTYVLQLTASDSELESSDTVTITVEPPANGAPTADDQSVTTTEDTAVAITLTGSDPEMDTLTFAIDSGPSDGTLTGTPPDVTYTPNTGFVGDDSFTYTANDGTSTSAPATVSITVEAAAVSNEAYWTFDAGSGTVAFDSLGDNDATIFGAEHLTDVAVNGAALDFNSQDDRVVVDDPAALDITGNEISLVAWILPRNGGKRGYSRVISKRTGSEADNADVYGMMMNNFQMRFMLDGGSALGGQEMDSTTLIQIDQWTHVAMVYDGTDMRIYINGELDGTTPVAKTDPIDSSARPVQLGRHEKDNPGDGDTDGRDFGGFMDEVRVLDRALTATEVQNLATEFTPPSVAGLFFADISAEVRNGIFPRGGQAVAFAEATNDNLPDFAISGAEVGVPHGDHFYENINGNFFRERGQAYELRDNSDDSGSHGIVWADLDNDGDYDQINGSTWSPGNPNPGNPVSNNIFENPGNVGDLSGDFVENTDPDIAATAIETYGVTAFDMDADGDLDIFAVGDSDNPGIKEAYLNDGGFAFTPHVGGDLTSATVPTMWGVTDTDYDGDGDIDVISANRGTEAGFDEEFTILSNDGSGTFTRVLPSTIGILAPDNSDEAKTGITTADVDNDGDLDILLASQNAGRLWRNDSSFYTLIDSWGGTQGWMGAFADLDNDGDLDLYFAGDERVFLNRGDGTFSSGQSVPVGGISEPLSVGFADVDNDGDLDFAVSAQSSESRLIRNDYSGDNNWLKVQLVDANGQAGAFGAKTFVYQAGSGQTVLLGMRESSSNQGYLSQSDPVLHFGLAEETLVDVEVRYLDGSTTVCVDVPADTRKVIDETAADPCNP